MTDQPDSRQVRELVKCLVRDLVDRAFDRIVDDGRIGRLTQHELELASDEYPGTLTFPPDEVFQTILMYDVFDRDTNARKVELDLWFDGERSDLVLSLDVRVGSAGVLEVTIDDVRVQ